MIRFRQIFFALQRILKIGL